MAPLCKGSEKPASYEQDGMGKCRECGAALWLPGKTDAYNVPEHSPKL